MILFFDLETNFLFSSPSKAQPRRGLERVEKMTVIIERAQNIRVEF